MTSQRPSIEPGLLASLSEAAPARLVRVLDKDAQVAERWAWQAEAGVVRVRTESGETVELTPDAEGRLSQAGQVRCSCLLAPKCLHLLAVVTRLPLVEGEPVEAPLAAAAEVSAPVEAMALTSEQQEAARLLQARAAELLDVGASAAGTRLQADLARAVHACKSAALPRAAAAGARLVRGIRDLREARPEFSLGNFAAELLELLEVTAVLGEAGSAPVDPAWIGTARRSYQEQGNLRLHGLFSEAVLAGSGASGVVTYLCDAAGRLYSVADVQPGEPERARGSYERGVRLGETSLSHRELCREGLFVQGATVSRDHRLGGGASVRAVRAGASSWEAAEIDHLFSVPLGTQLHRAYAGLALPLSERPAGSDLVFLRGRILGSAGPALLLQVELEGGALAVRCLAMHDHAELGIQSSLILLARTPGLRLRVVARVRFEQPRTLALLAFGAPGSPGQPAPDGEPEPALALPATWVGRCNLGLDPLQASHLRGVRHRPLELEAGQKPPADPLHALRRRLQRLALGGRATLPAEAGLSLEKEARWLEQRMLPTAAALLRELLGGAVACQRTLTGERQRGDAARLARGFLAGALYQRACARHLEEQAWLDG